MAETRHADDTTIGHIIDLRKRLAEAERQRDNALDHLHQIRMEKIRRRALELREAIDLLDEEERNC